MSNSHKIFLREETKMLDLINESHCFLLLLQHFEIDFAVGDKTIEELCSENNINPVLFIAIGNLYNGYYPTKTFISETEEIRTIITFLKNSHRFFIDDKYPELQNYLHTFYESQKSKEAKLIEKFFNEYFDEVKEHLDYEENIVFPYFNELLESGISDVSFSVKEYREHHSDIETKVLDLKNLFLKHIQIKNNLSTKRKFLNSLKELEFDLNIHSLIEEIILIPAIESLEKKYNG